MRSDRQRLEIVFPVFPGLTQLDFAAPHQVLKQIPSSVLRIASTCGGLVVSDDGIGFMTERLVDVAWCDVLCVPGGATCTDAIEDGDFMAEIDRLGCQSRYVTSVCTGSLILAAAGFLRGRRATSHWAWRDYLTMFGATVEPDRVVRDGHIFTGGGVTAGIDFALTIVAEIAGEQLAKAVQLGLEYAPSPPFDCGRPETADPTTLSMVEAAMQQSHAKRAAALARAAEKMSAREPTERGGSPG